MKKLFTLLVLLTMILCVNAQKKVLYLGHHKTTMRADLGSDTLLLWLKSIPNVLTVDTTIDIASATSYAVQIANNSTNGVNDYDLVIMNDMLDGKRCSTLTAAVITKPLLMIKPYGMTSGRLNMGTPQDMNASTTVGGPLHIEVPAASKTNPIFTGITISDSSTITIFNKSTNDLGKTDSTGSVKGLQTIADNSYTVNPVEGLTVLGRDTMGTKVGMALFQLAPNTNMFYTGTTGQTYTVPVIVAGYNAGATWARNNITKDGMRILQNAVYILAGLDPSLVTSAPTVKVSGFTVRTRGNQFEIQLSKSQKTTLTVYSITGKLIEKRQVNGSNAIVNLEGKAKGVYLIKVGGMSRKVVVK